MRKAHVQAVYESAVERQFSTADINTIISFICNAEPEGAAETLFVSLRDEFAKALADPTLRREIVYSRDALFAAGFHEGKYQGDKWGGKYLRAPDIYHHILHTCADKLVRLGEIAAVTRGVITGANRFFFLTASDIERWGIEADYLQRVMTTPIESRSLLVNVSDLPHWAFMCHEGQSRLIGTNSLEYIRWGEKQGFNRKSAPASRKLWYDLGNRVISETAVNIFVGTTARTVLASEPLLFSDNFQVIRSNGIASAALCLSMNSTFSQLVINVEGRTNFGQGVLEIQTYEVSNFKVVDPRLLPTPVQSDFAGENWEVLNPSEERRQLDDVVYDALGLTMGERDAVHESVDELVQNRGRRAASIPG